MSLCFYELRNTANLADQYKTFNRTRGEVCFSFFIVADIDIELTLKPSYHSVLLS